MLKLPKWLQDKFRKHLKRLQRQGTITPPFKEDVELLNDLAGLANHAFFTSTSTEVKSLKRNEDHYKLDLLHLANLITCST